MAKYECNILYKGQVNYVVEAESSSDAEDEALRRFKESATADIMGTEWEEARDIIVTEIPTR